MSSCSSGNGTFFKKLEGRKRIVEKKKKQIQNNTYHKSSFAMAAFEAGFMIRHSFKGQHVNNINSLITGLAFVKSSSECHSFSLLRKRSEIRKLFEDLKERTSNVSGWLSIKRKKG